MAWLRCSVCSHPARTAIEKAVRKAKSLQFVADRYSLTDDDLKRHRNEHMTNLPAVTPVAASPTVVHSRMDPAALFEEHNECIKECLALIDYSKRTDDTKGWALGVREWRGCLDQKNKMLGLYDQVDPRLQRAFASRIIEVVARALEQFPEARVQVLAAIDQVESGDG
jgi:hypothetical protein